MIEGIERIEETTERVVKQNSVKALCPKTKSNPPHFGLPVPTYDIRFPSTDPLKFTDIL